MSTSTPAPIIIASHHRGEREITGHFLAFHAVSPGDAVAYTPRPIVQRRFDRLLASGAVKPAGKGLYWLDLAAYHADVSTRRAKLVGPVIVASVLIAGAAVLFYQG